MLLVLRIETVWRHRDEPVHEASVLDNKALTLVRASLAVSLELKDVGRLTPQATERLQLVNGGGRSWLPFEVREVLAGAGLKPIEESRLAWESLLVVLRRQSAQAAW